MKTLSVGLFGLVAATASANLILNGDFEVNTAAGTNYNLKNADFTSQMATATGYGAGDELDIMTFGAYGLSPQSGSYKVGMATGRGTDAMTLKFSSAVTAGVRYNLSFWAYREQSFTQGDGSLNVGISGVANAPGTQVFATGTGVPNSAWTQFTSEFLAPTGGGYLSVEAVGQSDTVWYHVDNFSLTAVPEPATMTALALGAAALIKRRKR